MNEPVVLVVDDEPAVCRLTARILIEVGFHALEVHSGEAAIMLLAEMRGNVQLVVSDNAMPGMTGEALAATMADRWPQTRFLLISGQGGPTREYTGPFLGKPFAPEALLGAIAGLTPIPAQ